MDDDDDPRETDEKRKKKEEERKKKEEERKQKEEEKRQRDEEKRQRDEEKKQRDEEKKRVREEEKKQKEEEKKQKEEEKKRKENEKKKKDQVKQNDKSDTPSSSFLTSSIYTQKNQLRLTSLFTKTIPMEKNTQSSNIVKSLEPSLFPPFYIKENVKMSKTNTFPITCTDNFMHLLKSQQYQESTKKTYLDALSHKAKQKRGTTTHIDIHSLLLPGAADILHNSNVRLALGMKLLQYAEDVRPAYYGTFTKKSAIISGKHPLARDSSILDYNVDSEAEWEPEGEGEDIHSDEDEDDPNTDMNDPEDVKWL